MNVVFCIITALLTASNLFASILSPKGNSSSGWFLFAIPIIVMLQFVAYVPDILCMVFSILYKKMNKMIFPILILVFAIVGFLIMSSKLMNELFYGPTYFVVYIYYAFKAIMILCSIILLIMFKDTPTTNNN